MGGPGAKLGHAAADIVARHMLDTKRRYAPEIVRIGMSLQHEFFSLTGEEHKRTTGGLWRLIAAQPSATGWVKDTAQFLGHGHGQWQTMLAGTATGAALSGGIGALITNELAPAIQEAIAVSPHGLLAPADLANAAARGVMSFDDALDGALRQGISRTDFRALVRMSAQWPNLGQIQDMLNRGMIGLPAAKSFLDLVGMDPDSIDNLLNLRANLLTPDQLAGLVTFGVLDQDQAATMAERSGTTTDDFALLVAGNGEPPSSEELLFAYRRKIIDKARLLRGITQGPIRNEWFDVIESLGQVPMSTADAIESTVQGNLSEAQAREIAAQNGLMPDQFDPLLATAGSPPGEQFMLKMLNRGLATEADVIGALRASRLKNKYVPLLLASARELLTTVEVKSAVQHGVITAAEALPMITAHGFDDADARIILASVSATKTATVRQLSESQILALYTDRAITADQAGEWLSAAGWTGTEISLLLAEGDLHRMRTFVNAAIAAVRSAYVARRIDEGQADLDMDTLGIPGDQKTDLIALWDLERAANVKELSLAQLGAALKKGILDAGTFAARVEGLGYTPGDTQILAGLYAAVPKTGG